MNGLTGSEGGRNRHRKTADHQTADLLGCLTLKSVDQNLDGERCIAFRSVVIHENATGEAIFDGLVHKAHGFLP